VFIEMPGLGDTIRMTEYETLLFPIAAARRSKYLSITDLLSEYSMLRNFLGTVFFRKRIFLNIKYQIIL